MPVPHAALLRITEPEVSKDRANMPLTHRLRNIIQPLRPRTALASRDQEQATGKRPIIDLEEAPVLKRVRVFEVSRGIFFVKDDGALSRRSTLMCP